MSNSKKKVPQSSLEIKPIVPKLISFWIKGTSSLIQHAWSEKALRMLRMTAAERRKVKKEARKPEEEAMNAMYQTPDGRPALPMIAFKAALISAAHKDLGIPKTLVMKAMFLPAYAYYPGLLAPMVCSEPVIREDVVRVGQGKTDLRYRPEFSEWGAKVIVEVDAEILTDQDILNLVNRAGFSVGLCEWRPDKGGDHGRFEIDTSYPMKDEDPNEVREALKNES